jgi:aconitate hydratase
VLALTEFLREKWCRPIWNSSALALALTLGDRATISNMAPEFGATAAMFSIDEQTIKYLKLTGRDDEQVALVESMPKPACGPTLKRRVRTRIEFDLSTWCVIWPVHRIRTSVRNSGTGCTRHCRCGGK